MEILSNYFDIHKKYDPMFEAEGIEELSDIDWIMVEVTGKKRSQLPLCGSFSTKQTIAIENALKERLRHIPLGLIFGKSEFYGRKFIVSNKVLIPRMDTEILIDKSIKSISNKSKTQVAPVMVLDVGTGSGAIAITLQLETGANVTAVDISADALHVAKENAKSLGANVCFIQSNLFEKLKGKKFDAIISNPPYIETEVIKELDKEVKDNEPHLALDGGADGLDFYRKIISEAPNYLNSAGEIIFEIGFTQAERVSQFLQSDFEEIEVIKDFGGNDRVVSARLRRKLW